MMKRICGLVCLALLVLAAASASAEADGEALDITQDCNFSTSYTRYKTSLMTDRKYTTKWSCSNEYEPYIQITMPAGVDCYGVYICFAKQPAKWFLQTNETGEWITMAEVTDEYAHVYVPLYGARSMRIITENTGKYQNFAVNEIFLFSQGKLPDWVQRWQPTCEDADLMFLVAHPDDELMFLGGAVPTYAVEQQRKVVVAYMTYSNTTRLSELLNGLWSMGVRNYPIIGEFRDVYTTTSAKMAKEWGKSSALSFVVESIRRTKPKVLVTHDFDGEYGHGAHRLTAELAAQAYEKAADAQSYPESAALYGTWQVQKLYAHLYPESQIRFDWTVPLQNMGGKTGIELATEAYALHVTQESTKFSMETTGVKYDNSLFGLVYSQVGPDVLHTDFLENVLEPVSYVPAPELPEIVASPSPVVGYQDVLPELNDKGFYDGGEFVYESDEVGLWVYVSSTLKVIIQRKIDIDAPLRWFEAEIWTDVEAGERLRSIQYDTEHIGKTYADAAETAGKYGVVFGMNADYYTYRVRSIWTQGIVIRDGSILVNDPYEEATTKFPNLDTLALFPDGHMEVYASYDLTAQEYLDMGATDVYSFGPYLINHGALNPNAENWGKSLNPRCAIGMVEPGHYVVVVAEGRMKASAGITMTHLASLMFSKGCEVAFNMDGGQTAVMLFMGKQLNSIGLYDGKTSARETTEILGAGYSEQALAKDDPK